MTGSVRMLAVAVAVGLLAACSSTSKTAATTSSTATTASTAGSTSTTAATPSGPVPKGFAPSSVTFVSASIGFALGNAPCDSPPCTSLTRTDDGGRTWRGIPAPRAPFAVRGGASDAQADAVSVVRFADESNGWAFGPGLWATHDGTQSWHEVQMNGQVVALGAAAGTAYALLTDCVDGEQCTSPAKLLRSAAGEDTWTEVPKVPGPGRVSMSDPLVLHGKVGYVAMPGTTPATTALFATGDGNSWHPITGPCSSDGAPSEGLVALAAPDDTTLFELCGLGVGAGQGTFRLYRSDHQGASPVPVAGAFQGASAAILTAATTKVLVTGQWSGATSLLRSTDGGKSFTPAKATIPSGGVALFDLGFTTATQGVVIVGGGGPGTESYLMMTRDGGATWTRITIS